MDDETGDILDNNVLITIITTAINQKRWDVAKLYLCIAYKKNIPHADTYLLYACQKTNNCEDIVKFLFLEIKNGNTNALTLKLIYSIGCMYKNTGELEEALQCFIISARYGNADALNMTAIISLNLGNTPRAIDLFKSAIRCGSKESMRHLGYVYEITHRVTKAEKYYRLAAEIGDTEAMTRLDNLYKQTPEHQFLFTILNIV